jgi:hypothetical protein
MRNPAGNAKDGGNPEQLRRENVQRAKPDERGDDAAHRPAVVALEKVADRQVAIALRLTPHARRDPERQRERAKTGGPVPPPGAQAVAVAFGGGTDRRSGADVRGQECRKDETG